MPNALASFLELEKNGKREPEIIAELQEQGFSHQEINDALNQSKIKKAVISPEGMQPSIMQQTQEVEEVQIPVPMPSAKKKKMEKEERAIQPAQVEVPQNVEYQYAPSIQQPAQVYEYGNPYGGYQQQAPSQGTDIETIEEIAEEIVNEKISEFKNKIDEMSDFKQVVQTKINDLDDRIKRVELSIDRLQAALIGKVQEYSRNIKDLGSEMRAVEGAFSNILNPLVDNIKELNTITEKMKSKESKSKSDK